MTVICAHQPNVLPGASVTSKIAASDGVIWLDEVQFSKGSWTNRNKTPDGEWFTVPVADSAFKPINRVKIGNPQTYDWRRKVTGQLREGFPASPTLERVCRIIQRPHKSLVGLNVALLDALLDGLGIDTPWYFQSHLDGGHAVVAVSENAAELAPISNRLAMMVEEVGGSIYLSGPSGRHYLDEQPFKERGIDVDYWAHEGENPCALQLVRERAIA